MLKEGGDAYKLIEDKNIADKSLFDDVTFIYAAAVSTTQISVNNLMKYIHMDQYANVKDKILAEIDDHINVDPWDA